MDWITVGGRVLWSLIYGILTMEVFHHSRAMERAILVIKIINDINIRAQGCPLWLYIVIICLDVCCRSHCWIDTIRLVTSCFDVGKRMVGNIMITVIMTLHTCFYSLFLLELGTSLLHCFIVSRVIFFPSARDPWSLWVSPFL